MDKEFLWKDFQLDKIEASWDYFFQQEAKKDYFFPLLVKLEEEYKNHKCWPRKENIFRLFREISFEKVKVVILGQDPYHFLGVADGLAFSTQKEKYIPPSLRNIFREFSNDLNCVSPTRGFEDKKLAKSASKVVLVPAIILSFLVLILLHIVRRAKPETKPVTLSVPEFFLKLVICYQN